MKTLRTLALSVGALGFLTVPLASEVRLKQATQPLTDAWQRLPIEPRGSTQLGISFRPPQVVALGLDARTTLQTLLSYPFQLIRLGAYWNRIELEPGMFYTDELDWQIDTAERAGKQIILYKHRQGIVAWQLEHEAVDPLGVEHCTWMEEASVPDSRGDANSCSHGPARMGKN